MENREANLLRQSKVLKLFATVILAAILGIAAAMIMTTIGTILVG